MRSHRGAEQKVEAGPTGCGGMVPRSTATGVCLGLLVACLAGYVLGRERGLLELASFLLGLVLVVALTPAPRPGIGYGAAGAATVVATWAGAGFIVLVVPALLDVFVGTGGAPAIEFPAFPLSGLSYLQGIAWSVLAASVFVLAANSGARAPVQEPPSP